MKTRIIAAFDFDGTITTKDMVLPFLFSFRSFSKNILIFLSITPFFLMYGLGFLSRTHLKEKLLTAFLKGKTEEELKKQGVLFAEKTIPFFLRKKALSRIAFHKKRKDILVLVSGSLSYYLFPWGKKEGFDLILTTTLEFDRQGCFTGKLKGKNCWGEEKVVLIKKAVRDTFSQEIDFLEAYGDTKGDEALLNKANIAHYKPFR